MSNMLKTIGSFLQEFFSSFMADRASSIIDKKESAGGKIAGILKANIFGWGTTDELLTLMAFVIASEKEEKGGLEIQFADLLKVAEIITEYDLGQRRKIVRMLGHSETEKETTKKPGKKNKSGTTPTEETVVEKTAENMRGARVVAMLSKMTKSQIRQYLDAVGATTTTVDELEALLLRVFGKTPEEIKNWTVETLGPNGAVIQRMNARRQERLEKSFIRRMLTKIL